MKRIVLYDASAIDRPTRADLHQLARLRLAARRSGCDLVLTGVGQRLRLLLAVTGLDEVFTIAPDAAARSPTGLDGEVGGELGCESGGEPGCEPGGEPGCESGGEPDGEGAEADG